MICELVPGVIVGMPIFARLTRGQVLSVREREFVEAARTIGAGHVRIMARHILPNVTAPLIIQASLSVAVAILSEATLSFLGLGVQPPEPSWGSMVSRGKDYLDGGDGNDTLVGGEGKDKLVGGAGDDLLVVPKNEKDCFTLEAGDSVVRSFRKVKLPRAA